MSEGLPSIAFVIPTKDRRIELRTMLRSLADQDVSIDQVILVDASEESNASVMCELPQLAIEYVAYAGEPSAAAQRNAGIDRLRPGVDLVCFFDDDQILLEGSLRKMLEVWRGAGGALVGAGFNLVNELDRRSALLKRSAFVEWLGLYSRKRGAVALSGWQTLSGVVDSDLDVEWLGSGAAVWRRSVLYERRFDEFFDSYSYLEDLDFSYGASRSGRLVIVAAAQFQHFPSKGGRVGAFDFGVVEVRNRLYFVRKHGLSLGRCCLAIGIRFFMTLGQGIFMPWRGGLSRAWGNVVALVGPRRAGGRHE